jgi:hypothetical protein
LGVPVRGQDVESGGESGDGVVMASLALGLELSCSGSRYLTATCSK